MHLRVITIVIPSGDKEAAPPPLSIAIVLQLFFRELNMRRLVRIDDIPILYYELRCRSPLPRQHQCHHFNQLRQSEIEPADCSQCSKASAYPN